MENIQLTSQSEVFYTMASYYAGLIMAPFTAVASGLWFPASLDLALKASLFI